MHVFHLKIKAYRFFYMQCVYVSTPNNWDKEKIKNQYVLIFFSDISIYFDKSERQSMIKKKINLIWLTGIMHLDYTN